MAADSNTATTNTAWIAKLDRERPDDDPYRGDYEPKLIPILKEYLLSTRPSPIEFARKIDESHDLSPADDHATAGFLEEVYELIFLLGRLIPYDGTEQDMLIQLLIQLRKLPSREFQYYGKTYIVWQNDPFFLTELEDGYGASPHGPGPKADDGTNWITFQAWCDQWVNFSSFAARCLDAGLSDQPDARLQFVSDVISEGVDKVYTDPRLRYCKIMVSTQYILLAGRPLANFCFKKNWQSFSPEIWRHWQAKFLQISSEESDAVLASKAKQAYQHMVFLTEEPST